MRTRVAVIVVCGLLLGAAPAAAQSDPAGVVRLAGSNRIETAVAISQDLWADGTARSAVLAQAGVAADALAATPLAKDGPLLLTGGQDLPDVVAAELTRALRPGSTVHIAGGIAAVSDDVRDAVEAFGFHTLRLAGADRTQTAIAIAEQVTSSPARVYLVDGDGFTDALVAGSVAARQDDAVVLLTRNGGLSPHTEEAMDGYSSAEVVAVGDRAAEDAGEVADRSIIGTDAYDTARLVAREVPGTGPAGTVALASGERFPDGLAGGAHAAVRGIPLLLSAGDRLSDATRRATDELAVTDVVVYGGVGAISSAVTDAILGPPPISPLSDRTMAVGVEGALIAYDVDSGISTTLASTTAGYSPAVDISLDRRTVAYTDRSAGSRWADTLWTVGADGSSPTLIATAPAESEGFGAPVWSPDGSRVAVTASRNIDESFPTLCDDIWVFDADGANGRIAHRAGGVVNGFDWTADGTRFVYANDMISTTYTCNDQAIGLWSVGVDGADPRLLTTERDGSPDVRSDGTVVFHRQLDCSACGRDLFTMQPDGTGITQLTANSGGAWPVWSPDETAIAYLGEGPTRDSSTIRTIPASGGQVQVIANVQGYPWLDW
ncbi:cell wall-binding repeat-containing protein [Euzebya pacifica]|uniref:cell wall-binding repeat-containing protein n=1 Tax=Euzebya pacifica TaxID=1608957 RepID=UPI0030F5657C